MTPVYADPVTGLMVTVALIERTSAACLLYTARSSASFAVRAGRISAGGTACLRLMDTQPPNAQHPSAKVASRVPIPLFVSVPIRQILRRRSTNLFVFQLASRRGLNL